MNRRLIAAASLLTIASSSALAGGVAFRFGEDSFGASIAGDISSESSAQFDWLHHEDGADMIAAGVFANGKRGSLTGRVGAKAIGLDGDDADIDGGAVAFGGDLGLPLNDILRLRAGLYYGPDAVAFGDVDGYKEWSVSAEFTIFQNSALQVGYAEYEFDAENGGTFEFEDGLFVRLQLRL
ncbi:YfaZ precursor [Spongiibacter sp. IMCC21906]|uniref:YfaZ family outer membrane protein n=1 Tax=Spongiibacter sp. IMCC21906 TaxID=1620392 RepID=UPI00062E05E9|nr:YfaZ family outer membrane protein [Spongiibacter sp. IMCC21906]AKH69220.1 YfaZ precursor [Spongiibacter sp. IMCC21906]